MSYEVFGKLNIKRTRKFTLVSSDFATKFLKLAKSDKNIVSFIFLLRQKRFMWRLKMDSGNIGFVLLCAAFVFVMTPGLAMFYGGLVRKKNVVIQ